MHLFCQISNALGIFPVIFLVQNEMYWSAWFLMVTLVLSTLYHLDETNHWALLSDVTGCTVLFTCIIYLYRNSNYTFTAMNFFSMVMTVSAAICFVLAGDDTSSDRYMVYHSAWHAFSLYGIAAFVYSYVHSNDESGSFVSRAYDATLANWVCSSKRLRDTPFIRNRVEVLCTNDDII